MPGFSGKRLLCFLLMIALGIVMSSGLACAKEYKQKGNALADYNAGKFKVLKNTNYGKYTIKAADRYDYSVNDDSRHFLQTVKGNASTSFATWTYLPKSYAFSGDMGNPQAIAVTPDGKLAYVTYPDPSDEGKGRIVCYDLEKLESLGVCTDEGLGDLRSVMRYRGSGTSSVSAAGDSDRDEQIAACVTFGPSFEMGHGSSFAYNPKDGCLWLSSKTGEVRTNLQRVDMDTLTPDLKINFTLKSTVSMGNNLCFDKKGRCYFFSYSGGGWCPKGTVKIYRGKINLKKAKKVSFKLIMQGIRNSANTGLQSAGYNPSNNRIYLIANSTIMSFPVAKLGKMKNADVHTTLFDIPREFEGLSFSNEGKGFLLVNRQPEIMSCDPGF